MIDFISNIDILIGGDISIYVFILFELYGVV